MVPLLALSLAGVGAAGALGFFGLKSWSQKKAREIEGAVPPAGRFVEVAGERLHLTDEGSGQVVLCIHGLSGNLMNFRHSLSSALAPAYRVICLDRPGNGYSSRRSDADARLSRQADIIADLIRAEGWERPVLVGHSLGGALVLAIAQRHPDLIGGLVLVSPLVTLDTIAADVFKHIDIARAPLRRLAADALAVPIGMRRRDKMIKTVFAPDPAPDDFGTRGGGALAMTPDGFYAASADLLALPLDLPGVTARLSAISVPVGVIYGMQDRILRADVQLAALRGGIPHLTEVTIDQAGHMPLISHVQATKKLIDNVCAAASE